MYLLPCSTLRQTENEVSIDLLPQKGKGGTVVACGCSITVAPSTRYGNVTSVSVKVYVYVLVKLSSVRLAGVLEGRSSEAPGRECFPSQRACASSKAIGRVSIRIRIIR